MAKNINSIAKQPRSKSQSKAPKPASSFWRRHIWVRILAWIAGSIGGATVLALLANTFIFTPIPNPDYGVSFSQKRASELGLDWKANYLAILDDLGFKRLRLMSYWDVSEPTRGNFDFSVLDWQMDEAAKRGVKVSLGIGLRQPRWPECHEPLWAKELGGNTWKQALYAYMEIVTERYKTHPALDTWQLENEGMNNWFGKCGEADRERLIEEYALLKRWDPDHKVIMSLSDQHGLPLGQPVPDVYGFSVYRLLWNDKIPPHGYITYPTPIWYHRMRAGLINMIQHRPIIIHELQMEPWGPKDTMLLSVEEQDKSMSVEQIGKMFMFARQLDIQRIDTWGAEWWYWRKTTGGDPRIWEAVRDQLNKTRQ